MQRGITGGYEITSAGGEQVRAFIPHPLPPHPPVDFSNSRQRLVERTTLALGRLDSITLLLPDPNLEVCRRTNLSFPTATKGINALVKLGIVRELTGQRRNRVFAYDRYLAILNEGTEP